MTNIIENITIKDRFTKTELKYVFPNNMGALKRLHDVKILVKRFFTDTDGRKIDKNTLPANLQTQVPFFVFLEMDRAGGFYQANKVADNTHDWQFITSSAGGDNLFRMFTGLNNIQNSYTKGDLLQLWTDSVTAPNYYCWTVISMDAKSFASFSQYPPRLYVEKFRMSSDNEENYFAPISLLAIDELGLSTDETITPTEGLNPMIENLVSVDVNLTWWLSKVAGLVGQYLFDTERITFSFQVKTI